MSGYDAVNEALRLVRKESNLLREIVEARATEAKLTTLAANRPDKKQDAKKAKKK